MRQMAMLVTFGAAFAFTAATGEAQLPKRGSYLAHFGHHIMVKITELEKDHLFVTGENIGTVFNDAGQGFLHAAAVVCPVVSDRVKTIANAHGLEDVEFATLEWVAWYNGSRLLEPLGYVSPAEFEKAYHDRQAPPVGLAVLT